MIIPRIDKHWRGARSACASVPGSSLSFVVQHLSFNPAVLFSATVHFQTLSHCIMASNRVKGWWVSHARSAHSSEVNLYSLSALHFPLLLPPLPPEPDGLQAIRRTNKNVTAIHGGTPPPPPLLGARGTFISMWLFCWLVAGLQRSGEPLSECDTFGERGEVNRLDVGTWVSSRAEAFRVTAGRLQWASCTGSSSVLPHCSLNYSDGTPREKFSPWGPVDFADCRFYCHAKHLGFWKKKKSFSSWMVMFEANLVFECCSSEICPVILANREKPSLLQLLWSSNILSALELQNVHGCVCVARSTGGK